MNKKHKKILNSIESFLILVSAISGCFSVSAFTSLVGILKDIMSSEVELKICVTSAVTKYYQSKFKKKKKEKEHIMILLAKLS